jgi:methylated-DNA-[protein]-cysteine S-methyltransferase
METLDFAIEDKSNFSCQMAAGVQPQESGFSGSGKALKYRHSPTARSYQMSYAYKVMKSPIGELKLVAKGSKLAAILWENDKPDRVRLGPMHEEKDNPVLLETERQLGEYFAGTRDRFELELDFVGTDFQRRVWEALLTIPYGETRSYRDIANQIGNAKAVRAVGAANGRNPISIIAPCHRVIGASGALTGFAGGLRAKELLLTLESGQTQRKAA